MQDSHQLSLEFNDSSCGMTVLCVLTNFVYSLVKAYLFSIRIYEPLIILLPTLGLCSSRRLSVG